MTDVKAALDELGLELPETAAPAGSYIPCRVTGATAYTSGQIATRDGELIALGRLGAEVDTETGQECARVCLLNALSALATQIELDRITQIVKVVVFVASDPSFTDQPTVANGASDLLTAVFGDAGQHARSAVGVAALPKNTPVEVELVVEFN